MALMEDTRSSRQENREGRSLQVRRAPTAPVRQHKTAQLLTIGKHSVRLPAPASPVAMAVYEPSKRVADVALAATLLFILLPVFIAVALAIWCEDRGKIFYYQTRVGRNGVHFHFFKFRSMVPNADKLKDALMTQNQAGDVIFKMENDPRITRVGRFIRRYSIDELPQLVNVLKGEMSLVGPRPHLPREVAKYTGRQAERLSVQPGLLCLREVFGRSKMTFEEWINLDLLYIEHRSVATDTMILLRTIPAVLMAEGAY
jgi:lipopolysaccharide/colanic/teichoic acid biosynthesis glycosyltransferase